MHTLAGWLLVILQIAAVMKLAVPLTACATGLDASLSSAAIVAQLLPASTEGRALAPVITYLLPKFTNGMDPPGLYLLSRAC